MEHFRRPTLGQGSKWFYENVQSRSPRKIPCDAGKRKASFFLKFILILAFLLWFDSDSGDYEPNATS